MRAPGMDKMLKLGNSMFRVCESARSKFFEEEVLRVWNRLLGIKAPISPVKARKDKT